MESNPTIVGLSSALRWQGRGESSSAPGESLTPPEPIPGAGRDKRIGHKRKATRHREVCKVVCKVGYRNGAAAQAGLRTADVISL